MDGTTKRINLNSQSVADIHTEGWAKGQRDGLIIVCVPDTEESLVLIPLIDQHTSRRNPRPPARFDRNSALCKSRRGAQTENRNKDLDPAGAFWKEVHAFGAGF